jgi:hypothetical protein
MPSNQVAEIRDEELRQLMESASRSLDEGRNYDCVRACADAYLLLLRKEAKVMNGLKRVLETERVKAGLERGMIRFAPLMFPRMAAKLRLEEGKEPEIVFDRQTVGFGEAIQYYEFTLNLICDAQKGELNLTAGAGGGLG